jgi:hypothetical protein
MRKLTIGILLTCFFSIAANCGGDGSSSSTSTSRVGAIRDDDPVNAVPEPSGLLLGATGALLIGLAIRRSGR